MTKETEETIEIEIIDLTKTGFAVGKRNRMAVFVAGLIPGDRAEVAIRKQKKNYAEAEVKRIIFHSEDRVKPICPHAELCGGCQIMHMDYAAQLRFKKNLVEQNLTRIGKIEGLKVEPIIGMKESVPTAYRNKVQIPVSQRNGKIEMGYYRAGSHEIVNFENCYLQDKKMNQICRIFKRWLAENNQSTYNLKTKKGLIHHLVIRKGKKDYAIIIVTKKGCIRNYDLFLQDLRKEGIPVSGLIQNIQHQDFSVNMSEENIVLYGNEALEMQLDKTRYLVGPDSFFQINTEQTEKLFRAILDMGQFSKSDVLYDLYCGVGAIALYLAHYVGSVYGIEEVETAVKNAEENARLNEINNATFIIGKVEDTISELVESGKRANVIILDPPRKGSDPKTLEIIMEAGPEKIIYVSCDPATLARDIHFLSPMYRVEKVQPVDLFPHSLHVEVIVLLSKLDSKKHISVEFPIDDMDLTRAECKATYKQIQNYVFENYGFKVSTLYIAQVKRKCGLEVRAHYNMSKNGNQKVPQCPVEKEEAIMDALRHFRMI